MWTKKGDKCATNKLHIAREVPWHELLEIVNLGKGNSGHSNTGNENTGNRNTGNENTGNWNQGDHCTGDFNISDYNTGCFNTEEHKMRIFDVESDLTFDQWRNSDAYRLLRRIDFEPTTWIWSEYMSDDEKAANPTHETTGGYLRVNDTSKVFIDWWNNLARYEKDIIKNIPNFNTEKFKLITGIDV